MKVDRKEFLRKSCITGVCICGFSALAFAKDKNGSIHPVSTEPDDNLVLTREWISSLLSNLNNGLDQEELRKIIRKSATVHYNSLKMDDVLQGFENSPAKFIAFIEKEWGWKVDYNAETKTIIADENKGYCVCPVLNGMKKALPAICYCSEGFAEKMFSRVIGSPVTATVISSVNRGDKSCKYQIEWENS